MINCADCGRELKDGAIRCVCGWTASFSRPVKQESRPFVSMEESHAAYKKWRGVMGQPAKHWTRSAFIEHYENIIANKSSSPVAREHARQALKGYGRSEEAFSSQDEAE